MSISNDDTKYTGTIDNDINIDEFRLPRYVSVKIEEKIDLNEYIQN